MSIRAIQRLHFKRIFSPELRILKIDSYNLCPLLSGFSAKRIIMSGGKNIANGLPLSDIVSELNKFADLSLAESWDNVGLLIEPFTKKPIKNILLTNDLTEVVMEESIEKKVDLIISYHPPIFSALKRITSASWKERLVAACLENRIALFSPHTSWDAVHGGVNDWLADAFENYILPNGRSPLSPSALSDSKYVTVILGPTSSIDTILRDLKISQIHSRNKDNESDICTIVCSKEDLKKLKENKDITVGTIKCENRQNIVCGMGRMLEVKGLTVGKSVELIKKQVGLPYVRLALAKEKNKDSEVQSIALCAGSGGSLLKGVKADLYVTGEMFHHDVLDANHKGASVILTNHSDSERGFLKLMEKSLKNILKDSVNITVSTLDSDPLKTV